MVLNVIGIGIGRSRRNIVVGIRGSVMETKASYIHYNHTDSCNRSRWTARESYQYMYGRPWQKVLDFYSDIVRNSGGGGGSSSLSTLFSSSPPPQGNGLRDDTDIMHGCEETRSVAAPAEDRRGRWERVTFKIVLSYNGGSFDGWQRQPGLETVQGLVEKALGRFVDDRKAQQLRDRSLPVEGSADVAGRTDKGVTALQQVCSFYTWRKDIKSIDIKDAINDAAPGKLQALFVSKVSRSFHPNFAAKWRHYFYIFPLDDGDQDVNDGSERDRLTSAGEDVEQMNRQTEYNEQERANILCNGSEELNTGSKLRSISVRKVNQLICQLEGKSLSYKMFARDTKASRSIGPPTECFMFHARAAETNLPCADQAFGGPRVMCVELIANRFLRKMVRVLVATAIREAAAGAEDDSLLKLMDASCRRATAPPAPPYGLCLVDVGYEEFQQKNCLIP